MAITEEFLLNYLTKYEIGDTEETMLRLAGGINNVDPTTEDNTDEQQYYDLEGGTEQTILGVTTSYTLAGHRKYANPAQEFVRNKIFKLNERNVQFKVTEPDGRIISGPATISGIKTGGGDPNSRGDFECTITFIGIPEDTPPSP
ncbi:phage tail tube protein [Carnobacterium maltaromaticum]|uniref:phage tail tube protein n=1 Tax=Carnobacterium maltaromaticum TaxID=2751 RepID=UPI0039AFDEDE